MVVTMKGRLQDITTQPVDEITRATVKAPVYTISATGITTSRPRTVRINKDGTFSVTADEGVGWLYLDGDGWSDSIKFITANGMTDFLDAVINAIPVASQVKDMLAETIRIGNSTLDEIRRLSKEYVFWKEAFPTDVPLEQITPGLYYVSNDAQLKYLKADPQMPGGTVLVSRYGTGNLGQMLYITSEAEPKLWGSALTSSGWQPWVRLDAGAADKFYRGALPVNIPKGTIAPGMYYVSNDTQIAYWGLPKAGTVLVSRYGTGNLGQMMLMTGTHPVEVYTSALTSTGWQPFTLVKGGGGSTTPSAPAAVGVSVSDGPGSGMKVIPLALTLGQGTMKAPTQRQYRVPFYFNAPITRWRLHITDKNPHTGESVGKGITINNVYVGEHATNGSFKKTPTRIGGAINLSREGEWVSGWRTEKIGETKGLLSYDYTATEAPFHAVAGAWNTSNMDSAATTFLDGNATPLRNAAFDMWIEAETYATTPVVAAFGDSLSSGAHADLPVYESTLSIYTRRVNALPVHIAVSGNAMQDFLEADAGYKLRRWEHLDKADVLIWAMGHNDVYRGRSFEQMRSDFDELYPILTSIAARSVVAATVTTRNAPARPEMHDVRKAWNAWLKSQVYSPMSDGRIRDVFDFSAVIDDGDEIKAPFNSGDDVHLTTAGYQAQADAITRPITSSLVATAEVGPPGPAGPPGAGNTTTVQTDAEAKALTGLPKGHKVYVIDTTTWYEEA